MSIFFDNKSKSKLREGKIITASKKKIRLYYINDIMGFGKYKGEDLKFIYTIDPEYLEWLIRNVTTFFIDINEFQKYHCIGVPKSLIGYYNDIHLFPLHPTDKQHYTVREYLEKYFNAMDLYRNPPENIIPFQFHKDCIAILEERKKKLT